MKRQKFRRYIVMRIHVGAEALEVHSVREHPVAGANMFIVPPKFFSSLTLRKLGSWGHSTIQSSVSMHKCKSEMTFNQLLSTKSQKY